MAEPFCFDGAARSGRFGQGDVAHRAFTLVADGHHAEVVHAFARQTFAPHFVVAAHGQGAHRVAVASEALPGEVQRRRVFGLGAGGFGGKGEWLPFIGFEALAHGRVSEVVLEDF